ncbi:phage tail protein [Xenorhabdus bovienii]|uniref:phage tail protein n=1 Tax=Xenorhabdus bovienii TaxID=40576 RepID=UPI0023B20FAB|nr:phage tail protein [Xenorhabdus bovienii]
MSTKYFALLTQLGADKLANAAALGTKIEITHMAVGDGGGSLPTPDTKQTKLINEKRRAAINTLSIDPKNTNQIISEQVIPESEGGWWIREIGLFDKDGILIAVGNCAESYKPQLQEGSGRTQTIRMILIVSSTESVTLKVDPSVVLATREYVDDSIQKHSNSRNHPDATLKEKGFVILSSAVDSNSETHAATPKAVKAAYDFANAANNNANGRVPSGRKVNGKALSEDIHLKASDVDAYNKTETDARVNDAKAQAKAANDNADGRVPAGRKVNGKALNADISLNSGDVGAYSKGETDIRVNEVKALANTANQNAANANNNANTRLEKNQNGADIPNKPKFVENLGLAEIKNQAQNAVPNSRKVNGKSLVNDVTLNSEDVGAFSQTSHMTNIPDKTYIGAFSCGQEGEWVKGVSIGFKGGDVGQIWIDSSAMLHTRFLNTNSNHKQQSYAVRGESYTKQESDGKYQPRGNYQPAGNYQSAGNYAVRGECYTIKESDSRYSYKGASLSWVQVYSGRIPESGEVIDLSEDVRGRQIFIWFESWGGSNSKAYSGIFVPPVSDITLNVTESWGDSAVIRIFNNGKSLQSIRNNGALYNVFVIK